MRIPNHKEENQVSVHFVIYVIFLFKNQVKSIIKTINFSFVLSVVFCGESEIIGC